ncbi:hypothetical protein JAO73_21855 [Hymenobacter sp. BT523]|uniref:hypothetical protein n=1 Tax=Hymenobacter sp. BT523 TaxID=2795725 RepID=UPI0018ECBF54|nr:hypothetical protein [Hymenobacter sp. BT523]MBJ6111682.1 hypothetical protein [Hymenobacter sp. BT523]
MNTVTLGAAQRYCVTLFACALLSPGLSIAQGRVKAPEQLADETYDTQKTLTVAVTKFGEARTALAGFIRQRAVRVQKQEETPEQLIAEFALPTPYLLPLDSLAASLGFVVENNVNAHDLSGRISELRAEEKRTADQIDGMQQQLAKSAPEERTSLRRDLDRATERLLNVREQQANIAGHARQAYVTLRLYDEVSFPTGNRRVSFVNMPGVEYAYLHLDNPKAGLTSPAYSGVALKYLVTRGKSYLNLGMYRPVSGNTGEEDFVNELFVINFGQDFYPRNFGRGRRRYFNLYTCYQLGGFILNRNNDRGTEFIPNLNLGIGVEIFKSKHVLLDTKASYFVPLHDHSRDLRGVLGQAAFNFVF